MLTKGIFINQDIGPNMGGPSGYLFNLVNGLKMNNKNIKVYSFDKKKK